MTCESKIMFHNLERSAVIENQAREKIHQLERTFPHLQSCDVTIELPHKHQHQGAQYEVRINLAVPGGEVAVNRQQNEDAYVALNDAFDAARRRLQDFEQGRRSHKGGQGSQV